MIEHERSYVFTWDGLNSFLASIGMDALGIEPVRPINLFPHNGEIIDDHYLSTDVRVRKTSITKDGSESSQYFLTKKSGSKADGQRTEDEHEIDPEPAKILSDKSILRVRKFRRSWEDGNYRISCDLVESPMKIGILEVESLDGSSVPKNVTEQIFKKQLRDCPLSAFQLFRRRIGICGGPSSGKSETGKIISHKLNTVVGANSFHVAEFATTYIQKYGRYPKFSDEFFIWHGQREREISADKANIIISDCPTFLAYVYMTHYNNTPFCFESALYLAKIYKRVLFDLLERYSDLIFLKIQNYAENNVRFQTSTEAILIEERIQRFLTDHQIQHTVATYKDLDRILNDLFYINVDWGKI